MAEPLVALLRLLRDDRGAAVLIRVGRPLLRRHCLRRRQRLLLREVLLLMSREE
jgi:hypothetical protein